MTRLLLALRRLILRALPGRLRRRHAEAMESTLRAILDEARRRGGERAVRRAALKELGDAARAVARARLRGTKRTEAPGPDEGRGGSLTGRRGGDGMTREVMGELRVAVRTLARRPVFAAVVAATVALGVGASTAMFTLVKDVLLDPLPYPEPDRLVQLHLSLPQLGLERGPVSFPTFEAWRDHAAAALPLRSLGAWQSGVRTTLFTGADPLPVEGARVTGDLLPTLGVPALLGRTLLPADEGPGGEDVIVLSHGLWTGVFGADPDILGRSVRLGETPHTVVGVMPRSFPPLRRGDLFWVPFRQEPAAYGDMNFLTVLARLDDGAEIARARTAVDALVRELAPVLPDAAEGRRAAVVSRAEVVTGDVRLQLLLLMGAVALLLAIACANLAGLMLTRGASRLRELAVRAALGAGRGRLIRTLAAEGVVVGAAGALLALPVAHLALRAALVLGPEGLPRREEIAMDPGGVAFALAATATATLLFSLLPALAFAGSGTGGVLAGGSGGTGGGGAMGGVAGAGRTGGGGGSRAGRGGRVRPGGGRWSGAFARIAGVGGAQRGLVAAQVALAVVLLTGAALLGRTLLGLRAVDTGFRAGTVLTFQLAPPPSRYEEASAVAALHDRVLEEIGAVPGVEAVGAAWSLPFGSVSGTSAYRPEGAPEDATVDLQLVPVRGPWFEAMGIPVLQGRVLREGDGEDGRRVILVNRSLAERAWPGEDPVGRRLVRETEDGVTRAEVVGVVPDVVMGALGEEPAAQSWWPHASASWARELYYAVRVDGDPAALAPAVRAAVGRVDPEIPLADLATMPDRLGRELAPSRFRALLVAGFALMATLLTLLGVYGVTAFVVARRTREIGVRLALGARTGVVLRRILLTGLAPVAAGIVPGLAVAALAGGSLEPLLFGVDPLEPGVYVGVAAAVLLVAAAAVVIPATRAARLDPTEALRAD